MSSHASILSTPSHLPTTSEIVAQATTTGNKRHRVNRHVPRHSNPPPPHTLNRPPDRFIRVPVFPATRDPWDMPPCVLACCLRTSSAGERSLPIIYHILYLVLRRGRRVGETSQKKKKKKRWLCLLPDATSGMQRHFVMSDFRHLPDRLVFVCPASHELIFGCGQARRRGQTGYSQRFNPPETASQAHCLACPLGDTGGRPTPIKDQDDEVDV
ncbi:hypothetical protein J3F83DRAFT_495461 [Trichoderma novae-zelandiae]